MEKIKKLQILGAVFTAVLGTLLHFTYEWSGNNSLIGIFSAVNESTWEHLKLLFVPALIFAVFEYFLYGKKIKNFIAVKAASLLLGMATIIVTFYTYSGIIGEGFLWADILVFLLSVFVCYFFSAKLLNTQYLSSSTAKIWGIIAILLFIFLFVIWTFSPPQIALFVSP